MVSYRLSYESLIWQTANHSGKRKKAVATQSLAHIICTRRTWLGVPNAIVTSE